MSISCAAVGDVCVRDKHSVRWRPHLHLLADRGPSVQGPGCARCQEAAAGLQHTHGHSIRHSQRRERGQYSVHYQDSVHYAIVSIADGVRTASIMP